ncbi:MAG: hypothetical protein H6858_05900 [Rhodospirillales bacterium]|nr:hypothetical protein [Alphaproteobacteria bacterium]MCB9977109.1 hypothetical protein [Rhodospirillales bacterium]
MSQEIMDQGDFVSRFGLARPWAHLESSARSTYATVSTDIDCGAIRVLLLQCTNENNRVKIRLKYMYHDGVEPDRVVNMLSLNVLKRHNGDVELLHARITDHDLDIHDDKVVYALAKTIKKFSDAVVNRNEWLNPVQLIETSGLPYDTIGKKAWPGLYVTGENKVSETAEFEHQGGPVYPVLFLPAILGVGPESNRHDKRQSRSLTLYGEGDDKHGCVVKYSYHRGKTSKNLTVTGRVAIHGEKGSEEAVLYNITTEPAFRPKHKHNKSQEKDNMVRITSLEYMGRRIDLTDQKAVVAILKVIRNINRMVRAGDQVLIDDLRKSPHERTLTLPTELMLHTGVYPYLNEPVAVPKEGIMSFAAIGGNNMTRFVSDADIHIGANQYVICYESKGPAKTTQTDALMIDAGVLFHDVFDVAFFNAGRYLYHKHDKAHQPEQPVHAILFTHRHKDHLGQLAYLVKRGYELPPLVMNEITKLQLKRDMNELDIEPRIRDEILSKCYAINLLHDVNPQNPNERKVTEIAGTVIEQYTEVLPGKDLGRFEYYPRLKIGPFDIRIGPMPHSDPGMMFDVITPAGSHRHTGDYKLDDTIKLAMPPLDIWLKGHQPDSLSADSTGATREGRNPKEADVAAAIVQEVNEHKHNRFIFPMLGTNLARLTTLIQALGQTDRKVLIVDGKAVEDLVRDSEKVFELREWAKRTAGVDILFRTQKTKVDEYLNDPGKDHEYALLVSGTQDEAFSSLNRAVRDWLPFDRYSITANDRICFLQGVIPTGYNAYRRLALKDFTELFHGASVVLPEIVEKEAELFFHASGHNNREDMKDFIGMSGNPFVLPVHGGPKQLEAHLELAREAGAESLVVPGTVSVRIQKGKNVTPYRILPSELIGVTLHTPGRDKFYLKGRFSTSILPVKPLVSGDAARLIDVFEDTVRHNAGITTDYDMVKFLPISLSRRFNVETVNGFLRQDMPFGIDKYKQGVLEDKGIFAIGAFDTETCGLDARRYLVREFGLLIQNRDRETIDSVQLFQSIPDYRMPSPIAMLVTNTAPADLPKGLPAHQFVHQMRQAIKSIKDRSYEAAVEAQEEGEESLHKNDIKALAVAHNTRFDSRFIALEEARNLEADTRPHQTRGIIAVDTRTISRALAAFAPRDYHVTFNPDTGLPDHSLEGLCEANSILYDTGQSHGALYDTHPCLALFWKQYDIAPDIVGQMIINADSSTNHLLNDMMGTDTGFGGPNPVFSYISPSANKPKPQMGCYIGSLDSDRYAVIFNLKYDPNEYIHLPVPEIVEMLADRENDVFEILDLRQQPIVMPARYGLRVKACGNLPKETLDRRASLIKRHMNYVDPGSNWMTISRKIDEAWKGNRDKIFHGRVARNYPDLEVALDKGGGKAAIPEDGAINLLRIRAQLGFNPVYQHIMKHIRQYLDAIREGKIDDAGGHYLELIKYRKDLQETVDTLNNVHYEIRPEDLTDDDRRRVESMRSFMAFANFHTAEDEIEDLLVNENFRNEYIGDDPKKQALFRQIAKWVKGKAGMGVLDSESKLLLHPWRKLTHRDYKLAEEEDIDSKLEIA